MHHIGGRGRSIRLLSVWTRLILDMRSLQSRAVQSIRRRIRSPSRPRARRSQQAQQLLRTGMPSLHHTQNREILMSYSCLVQSKQAYENGDGARAKQLSEEGKEHGRRMQDYNKQASEFIFRENNASGRVPEDTIDLHGQFVEEAEDILEERIKYARQHGQTHLHVYVPFPLSQVSGRKGLLCTDDGIGSSEKGTIPPTTCKKSNLESNKSVANWGFTMPRKRTREECISI